METLPMRVFDTHVHYWDLEERKGYPNPNPSFNWPNENTPLIFKDFLPGWTSNVKKCIFVQALNNCPEEIRWIRGFDKEKTNHIKGIIGGLDLTKHDELIEYINEFRTGRMPLVGLRHILDAEENPLEYFKNGKVLQGLEIVENLGDLTIDLLLRPHSLTFATLLAKKFPRLKFVIDHAAKPQMTLEGLTPEDDEWVFGMKNASRCDNVYVKISGLITEVRPKDRSRASEVIRPFTDKVLSLFGPDRCIFGSDSPVFVDSIYDFDGVLSLTKEVLSDLSAQDTDKVFYGNAAGLYGLN